MQITVTYGGAPLVLDLPEHITVETFAPHKIEHPISFDYFHSAFAAAWKRDNSEFLSPLIIVNDAYRHTPTAIVLTWLERVWPGLLQKSRFLIATGSHHAPTDKDLQSIFAGHLKNIRPRVESHVATDMTSMTKVGVDSFGKDVFVNSRVL